MSYFKGSRFPLPQTLLERVGIPLKIGAFMRKIVKEMSLEEIVNNPLLPNTHDLVTNNNKSAIKLDDHDILFFALSEAMGNKDVINLNPKEDGESIYLATKELPGFNESLGFNKENKHFWIGNIKEVEDRIKERRTSHAPSYGK